MLVSYIRNALQIDNVQFRISDEFGKNSFGLFVQLSTHRFGGDFGNKTRLDSEGFQIME